MVLLKRIKEDIKNVDHMINLDIATVRECSELQKWGSGKVIFATDQGKIDQRWQVPPTELPQNIEFPPFLTTLLEFQEKFPLINMSHLKSWYPPPTPPPPLQWGGEGGGSYEKVFQKPETGPLKRGVLLYAHVSTHMLKHLEVW